MSASTGRLGWIATLRWLLPQGRALPEAVWRVRHSGIVVLLWVHAVVIPLYALARGFPLTHSVVEGSIVPLAAILAMHPALGRRLRTAVASLGLLTCSAVLVHLSGGLIEMHFHFFVMVAVVALYQDWVPFLTAVGYVFVHHGLMGAISPESVFNHPAARNNPWGWAAVHAFFITGISAACLITWRLNEAAMTQQRRAEERLREETRIVEILHRIGNILVEDLDTRRVVQAVTDTATEATHAHYGAFFYNVVDDAGEAYMLYTLSGAPREAFQRFGLPRKTPIFAPTFDGKGAVRLDDVTADPRYGTMAPHHGMPDGHLPVRSYLAVPVRSRTGDVLGGLFFGHPETGKFTAADERIVVGIAAQAAMALDNARLYEAERLARTTAEAARVRMSVLADAGRILTSSLEAEELLSELAKLLATTVADYCVIEVLADDAGVGGITVASCSTQDWISVAADGAHLPQRAPVVAHALQSGSPVVELESPAACIRDAVSDESYRAVVDRQGVSSALIAPLVASKQAVGALVLGTALSSGRHLRPDDVSYAEELARRVATAVEKARLYARQRTVAETLQHSLLPDRLPEIPGLNIAARYLPGGPDVEIGGDWYDVIQLPNGRIALAMGDVVGRGEQAASLMGQLRNSVRAYAQDGKPPADVMQSLNALLMHAGPEQMATMLYAVLNTENGELSYVNAGHPPPLIVDRDRASRFLNGVPGLPLGASPTARYHACDAVLSPGGSIVLFTDGLVEDRWTPLDVGLSLLKDAVFAAPDDTDEMCGYVVRHAMVGRTHQDDLAILAVHMLPLGQSMHFRLPSQPTVLGPLRAVLRRWFAAVGASEQERFELLLATMELCTNAIRHAGTSPDAHFELLAEADDAIRISVRDQGRWREPGGTVGGRGLAIAEGCVDHMEIVFHDVGSEVRLERRLKQHVLSAGS